MQQTLLRIDLTAWFRVETVDGILHVGSIVLLIPWLLLGVVEWIAATRASGGGRPQLGFLGIWAGIGAAILCLPLVAASLPVQSMPIFGWGLMLVLGFIAAAVYTAQRGKSIGLPSDTVWDMGTHVLVAGLIGARTWYVVQKREHVFRDSETAFDAIRAALNLTDGGMVLYGGVLCAVLAFWWFAGDANCRSS